MMKDELIEIEYQQMASHSVLYFVIILPGQETIYERYEKKRKFNPIDR